MAVGPEKAIEEAIKTRLQDLGYLVMPLTWNGRRGFPDLTVVGGGKVIGLEVKRGFGGKISAQQYNMSDLLIEAGWPVFFVTDVESAVNHVITELE